MSKVEEVRQRVFGSLATILENIDEWNIFVDEINGSAYRASCLNYGATKVLIVTVSKVTDGFISPDSIIFAIFAINSSILSGDFLPKQNK